MFQINLKNKKKEKVNQRERKIVIIFLIKQKNYMILI